MSQNVPFKWSAAKLEAAELLAELGITEQQVADKVGITRRQLVRWKQHPDFKAKVQECLKALDNAFLDRGIARRIDRARMLQDRQSLMLEVIAARAADPRMQGIPGGKTGLLVIRDSELGIEEAPDGTKKPVEVPLRAAVDVALLREMREHEKQAAQELGQWTEKRELTGKDGAALPIMVVEVVKSVEGQNGKPV